MNGRAIHGSSWGHADRGGLVALVCLLCACSAGILSAGPATNVILFIGDGMGPEQVQAGACFKGTNLVFENWAYQGEVQTRSASSAVTDSAASATAMATGHKVNNGVISIAAPGNSSDYETVLEYFRSQGRKVGLVTTTFMTHATPAGFGAHAASRNYYTEIASDYLTGSRPHVLLGGGKNGMSAGAATTAGYTVVTDRSELLQAASNSLDRVSGQFGSSHLPYEYNGLGALPHLYEMTACALQLLEQATNGFFLMVEGGLIDLACHANNITNCVREVAAFDDAVQVAVEWAGSRTDTLMIVTADHETGGLMVLTNNGTGIEPTVSWSTIGHTARNVGVYSRGPGAAALTGVVDNVEIYRAIMRGQPVVTSGRGLSVDTKGTVSTTWSTPLEEVCRLETTDSLFETNWTAMMTITAETHVVTLSDAEAAGVTQRFYRLVCEP